MEPRPSKKTAKQQARPYARAAFETARDGGDIDDWELLLQQLAEILKDPELKELPHDPRLKAADLKSIMGKVMDELEATEQQRNLVNLLIKDKKLSLLPWVYDGFVVERKKAEGQPEQEQRVEVISAFALTPQQEQNVKDTLRTKFNVKAEPQMTVDPDLIGGLKIIIGDRVYDQTVKGQLERMRKHLKGP